MDIQKLEHDLNVACVSHMLAGGRITHYSETGNEPNCNCPIGCLTPDKPAFPTPIGAFYYSGLPVSITRAFIYGFENAGYEYEVTEEYISFYKLGQRFHKKYAT